MKTFDVVKNSRVHTEGHSSKGDQPKWSYNDKWYKADYMGYEALAEIVISRLLQKSNAKDFVVYQPVEIKDGDKTYIGCESANFREKNEQLIPFERLHRAYKGIGLAQTIGELPTAKERIKYTVDFIESVTNLIDVGTNISMLLELDAFFLNEDRHTNNLAVIRNEDTLEFRLCPIFDNGLALLSDTNDYPIESDIYECISKVKAKPFDMDFDEQLNAAEELYGSPLKFEFTKKDVSEILGELSDIYSKDITSRVERVMFEQMRKYPIYFK